MMTLAFILLGLAFGLMAFLSWIVGKDIAELQARHDRLYRDLIDVRRILIKYREEINKKGESYE